MKQRKVPMRKDIISQEMKPKKEMVRIVKTAEGEISIDPTGKKSGRGAYVSLDPEAIKVAQTKKILEATFSIDVSEAFYTELFEYVDHQKARQELFGANK
ncbi:RNase P modulator RnpM [Latilactobacillus fuchuensis]|nr:YlxR family protein [Latilactobacillus fuchuensis]MCP8858100.1 YlxR family protein [Latilactobacillus fuchuensis]